MRVTQKIKSVITILKDIENECGNNYFNINKSKFYVLKNNLYKNQKYDKPIGSIKNGVIVLNRKRGKSLGTLKKIHRKLSNFKNKSFKYTKKNNSFETPEYKDTYESEPVFTSEPEAPPESVEPETVKSETVEPEEVEQEKTELITETPQADVSEPAPINSKRNT